MSTRNFHVPLTEELYVLLQQEARERKLPATRLAREAIEHHLRFLRRATLFQQISDFADEHAGTDLDLDPELEEAGLQAIHEEG